MYTFFYFTSQQTTLLCIPLSTKSLIQFTQRCKMSNNKRVALINKRVALIDMLGFTD